MTLPLAPPLRVYQMIYQTFLLLLELSQCALPKSWNGGLAIIKWLAKPNRNFIDEIGNLNQSERRDTISCLLAILVAHDERPFSRLLTLNPQASTFFIKAR